MEEQTDETQGPGSGELFGELPLPPSGDGVQAKACGQVDVSPRARVLLPNRSQIELRPMDLESLLPEGHRARLVWAWVERQDLSGLYATIKVREGGVGRSAIAPQILLALWLYATLERVGSARQLSRLVLEHDAWRWISGGVQVNHHSLSDFRVAHGAALDELLSTSLAALLAAGAVKLDCVAQDGMRVRAAAGAASFRRKASLQEHLEQARTRVSELKAQIEADPAQDSRRKVAAQQRACRERQQRLQSALDRLPELEAIKRRNGGKAEHARASSTDAQASVMKMADGGFRPAYNTQYAADSASQVIVGVEVTTSGSDMGQMAPMVGAGAAAPGQCAQVLARRWRLSRARAARCGGRDDRGLCAGARAAACQGRARPVGRARQAPAQARRFASGGELARAHGKRRGQGPLQAACGHGRVRQRAGQKPRPAAPAGARAAQGALHCAAVCSGAQPDAHAGPGTATAWPGPQCVRIAARQRIKTEILSENPQSTLQTGPLDWPPENGRHEVCCFDLVEDV